LSEVLITLAIIGVIAAITIPSIVANHQKRALETQFTKAYRTLSQAVNLAIAEHGGIETWDWKDGMTNQEKDAFVKKYFESNLNIVKFCSASTPGKNCFPDVTYKLIDTGEYRNIDLTYNTKTILADGSAINFAFAAEGLANNQRCLTFGVDINGHKKPNTVGRDYFEFAFYPQTGEFLPHGVYGSYNTESKSYEKQSVEKIDTDCTSGGWTCAAKIVSEGFKINY